MFNIISKALEKPKIYTPSDINFWDDEHISKQMLKAHLDPAFEGASRKLEFINKSVEWITESVPPSQYHCVLDLGCGPGLYAERFANVGFDVTGIDFSKRSISYAKNSASCKRLNITYQCQNYLEVDFNSTFDFVTLIYCDYGALSAQDRQKIMQKVFCALKPGGKFLLDVFSVKRYNSFQEIQNWEICLDGGFWSAEEYLALNGNYKYQDNVTLEHTTVISDSKITNYYIWNCHFTRESLINEAQKIGFTIVDVFSDVAGSLYDKGSSTISILLEK